MELRTIATTLLDHPRVEGRGGAAELAAAGLSVDAVRDGRVGVVGAAQHLGGEELAPDENDDEVALHDELVAIFAKYDLQKTGLLTHAEVNAMLLDLGYETDDEYLNGLMQSFGQFDVNDDGLISLAEFGDLFEFVGGHERVAEVSTEHKAATKIQVHP